MTKDEALRLALEALEKISMGGDPRWADQAITAIKAALEAKDEPVACKECHLKDTVYDLLDDLKVANLKLSVRSQRTWVGLTDEEIWATISRIGTSDADVNPYAKLADARAIEAKLKEKNT
jgi:hypothetical protein